MQIVPLQTALKGGVKGGAKGNRQPVRYMLLQCRTARCSSNPHRVATSTVWLLLGPGDPCRHTHGLTTLLWLCS